MGLTALKEFAPPPPPKQRTLEDALGETFAGCQEMLAAIDAHYGNERVRVNGRTSPRRCVAMAVASLQALMHMIHGRPENREQGIRGEPDHPEIGSIPVPTAES